MKNIQWHKHLAQALSKTLLGMGERYVGVSKSGITVVKRDKAGGVN